MAVGNIGFKLIERPGGLAAAVTEALAGRTWCLPAQHCGLELPRRLIVEKGGGNVGAHLGWPSAVRRVAGGARPRQKLLAGTLQ